MHVFSGFSRNGFIVYGENIYKEYNRKKNYKFCCCLNLTKTNK